LKKCNKKYFLPQNAMQESLLHHIWHHRYFRSPALFLVDGRPLHVLHVGTHNPHQGADFKQARLQIGDTQVEGDVEIHVCTSNWFKHQHHQQAHYQQVVLHVVWQHDLDGLHTEGIPILELRHYVNPQVLNTYRQLVLSPIHQRPLCAPQWQALSRLHKIDLLEKAVMRRMEEKAQRILQEYAQCGLWEEVAYRMLAYAWGLGQNAEAFLKLSRLTPLKMLQKHRNSQQAIEAILFGQSGLLPLPGTDDYSRTLAQEYAFYKHKFSLQSLSATEWKFLRMRPSNFPTFRLAQWAYFLSTHDLLHNLLLYSPMEELQKTFTTVQVSDYWKARYRFGDQRTKRATPTSIGRQMVYTLLINAVVPYRVAYGLHNGNKSYIQSAMDLLQALPPENNRITRFWSGFIEPQSAYDSQALIGQYKQACLKKECLSCVIGNHLLRKSARSSS
jgi:hypothetical protein